MRRGCLNCWAYFEKETDEDTLTTLRKHQEKCTKEKPFRNDRTADGYDDF